jgi:hypothetical protein
MSRKNGGIIGPANTPVGGLFKGVAGGVWRMNDVANFVGNSQWPLAPQNIDNSLRFDDGSSDSLTKTLSSSNRKIYTISTWVKRSELGSVQNIFTSGANGVGDSGLRFLSGNNISFYEILSPYSSYDFSLETNAVFRDVSAWYHIVISVDTTQATDSNRIKIYVNNSQITSFSSASYPSQDFQGFINHDFSHQVSGAVDTNFGNRYFNGYQAEFVFIDGQQLDPTSFGEFDTTTGIWKPKKIGQIANAGTNSFYLDFKDSSNVGNDASGLNNDFTVNNLTSIDQATDTCVVNFATYNSIFGMGRQDQLTYSEGNTVVVSGATSGGDTTATSNFAFDSGKWYAEFKLTSDADGAYIGVATSNLNFTNSGIDTSGNSNCWITRGDDGTVRNNGSTTYFGTSFSNNDIIQIAIDMDNSKIWWGLNGTYGNSGNPGTGANAAYSNLSGELMIIVGDNYSSKTPTIKANFGNPSFSISSGNSDANGFGNFEYAVPSGYYALNTSNLNTYG